MQHCWRQQRLSLDTKLRLYQTCILQILLYGADTWRHGPCWQMTFAGLFTWDASVIYWVSVCQMAGLCEECRRSWHNRPAKHYWHNQQETPCTVRTCSQTGCAHQALKQVIANCNESWPLLGYELAKTSWTSSTDVTLYTADWWRNNNQLETDVAECRGAWTSSTTWRLESRRNGPQPSIRVIYRLYFAEVMMMMMKLGYFVERLFVVRSNRWTEDTARVHCRGVSPYA